MVTIRPLDHVPHCYTDDDGTKVGSLILNALAAGEDVAVSFQGTDSVSSSFVNGAFLDLLDHYDYQTLKRRIRIVHSTRQINHIIKARFDSVTRKSEAAT